MKRFLLLVLLYVVSCLVGAALGGLVFAFTSGKLIQLWGVDTRDFSGLLILYLLYTGGVLGAFTGLAVTLSHSGYCKVAAWLGAFTLLGAIIWIVLRSPDFNPSYGRRLFLSIEGLAFCWAMILAWWSARRAVAHVITLEE